MRHLAQSLLLTFLLLGIGHGRATGQANNKGDLILGKWKADEKILTIEIYRQGSEYRARIVCFKDQKSKIPADQLKDEKNPNPTLRSRKVIGMDVMHSLQYTPNEQRWTGGTIYHAGSGKQYDANVELSKDGKLEVRAFKGFSLLGKTMTFHRGT